MFTDGFISYHQLLRDPAAAFSLSLITNQWPIAPLFTGSHLLCLKYKQALCWDIVAMGWMSTVPQKPTS